jgi:hypothetical protein
MEVLVLFGVVSDIFYFRDGSLIAIVLFPVYKGIPELVALYLEYAHPATVVTQPRWVGQFTGFFHRSYAVSFIFLSTDDSQLASGSNFPLLVYIHTSDTLDIWRLRCLSQIGNDGYQEHNYP